MACTSAKPRGGHGRIALGRAPTNYCYWHEGWTTEIGWQSALTAGVLLMKRQNVLFALHCLDHLLPTNMQPHGYQILPTLVLRRKVVSIGAVATATPRNMQRDLLESEGVQDRPSWKPALLSRQAMRPLRPIGRINDHGPKASDQIPRQVRRYRLSASRCVPRREIPTRRKMRQVWIRLI